MVKGNFCTTIGWNSFWESGLLVIHGWLKNLYQGSLWLVTKRSRRSTPTRTRDFYYMFAKRWSSFRFMTYVSWPKTQWWPPFFKPVVKITSDKDHESLCGSSSWIRLKKGKKDSRGTVSRGWVYVTRGRPRDAALGLFLKIWCLNGGQKFWPSSGGLENDIIKSCLFIILSL